MAEDWLDRWSDGRIGWHEKEGNAALMQHWPNLPGGSRILVPLCGKTPDLAWLARNGCDVTGVELSSIACKTFFDEQQLAYEKVISDSLDCYVATELPLRIFCGDYFEFRADPFDALFDRGSLVAFPAEDRPAYVRHTQSLINADAFQLLLTLEYEQSAADGPPWSVTTAEVHSYWPNLQRISSRNDIGN